jgi:hypothetical protein
VIIETIAEAAPNKKGKAVLIISMMKFCASKK